MRKSVKRIGQGMFAAAMATVVVVGMSASAPEATAAKKPPIGGGGGGIYCLDVWKPVICPNGQVYSNDCYALRAGQVGCVPWGGDIY